VSNHQGDIDWKAMRRDGVHWAGVKATEGADYTDGFFNAARVKAMRDAGVVLMPYHYLRWRTDRNGAREAEFFVRTVEKAGWQAGRDLPLSVDMEWEGNVDMLHRMGGRGAYEYASDFCEKVKAETGRGVVSYLAPGFAPLIGNRAPRLGGVAWVADIDAPDGRPHTPRGFDPRQVLFHQTSWSGSLGGEHPLDLDLFLGDMDAFEAFIDPQKENPKPEPEPPPPKPDGDVPKYPGKPLRLGSSGQAVKTWQSKMRERGWAIAVDGEYGPHSERVCQAFQQEKGLEIDGVVGPKTWEATWELPVTKPQRPPKGSIASAHPEVTSEVADVAQKVVDEFPELVVTSTTRNGSGGSYHDRRPGRAIDLAVLYSRKPVAEANAYMDRAARWANEHLVGQLTEGIHNPGLSVKNRSRVPSSYWGPGTWDAHRNHLHFAV
ncbi:MAG: peptidoglycan-binding protein, partial [Actinobacteria bacterium]|nr:peptidoglycan-binding protein [Actinomycetota bacterium]